jgi:hypothetical protein
MQGNVKNTVYTEKIHDLYHLRDKIYAVAAIITLKTVHCTLNETEYSLDVYRAINIAHTETY